MDILGIGKATLGLIDTVADKCFVNAKDKESFKLKARELQQNGDLKDTELQLSAIVEEARSSDPWTSRARPSFLYVMYIMILASIPMGILSSFRPDIALDIATGMKAWLAAIPKELWSVFGIGYLGYTGARQYGKLKGSDK